jgi:hypothetical protein
MRLAAVSLLVVVFGCAKSVIKPETEGRRVGQPTRAVAEGPSWLDDPQVHGAAKFGAGYFLVSSAPDQQGGGAFAQRRIARMLALRELSVSRQVRVGAQQSIEQWSATGSDADHGKRSDTRSRLDSSQAVQGQDLEELEEWVSPADGTLFILFRVK